MKKYVSLVVIALIFACSGMAFAEPVAQAPQVTSVPQVLAEPPIATETTVVAPDQADATQTTVQSSEIVVKKTEKTTVKTTKKVKVTKKVLRAKVKARIKFFDQLTKDLGYERTSRPSHIDDNNRLVSTMLYFEKKDIEIIIMISAKKTAKYSSRMCYYYTVIDHASADRLEDVFDVDTNGVTRAKLIKVFEKYASYFD